MDHLRLRGSMRLPARRARQQVKEDDVGASPDQEHDQKRTCAASWGSAMISQRADVEKDAEYSDVFFTCGHHAKQMSH